MSVIVDATYEGETFGVEIFRDGTIEFPGRDFQYEQAVAEFAPPGPITVQFYDLWKKSPVKVICKNLELPENSLALLAADYAEHVLHIYEDKNPGDLRPRAAIEATRNFIAGKIDLPALERARVAAWTAWTEMAARAAAEAGWAAAYNVSSDPDSIEWQQGRDTEVAWQVRRFVDVIEAIGQGNDWPDLGVTP